MPILALFAKNIDSRKLGYSVVGVVCSDLAQANRVANKIRSDGITLPDTLTGNSEEWFGGGCDTFDFLSCYEVTTANLRTTINGDYRFYGVFDAAAVLKEAMEPPKAVTHDGSWWKKYIEEHKVELAAQFDTARKLIREGDTEGLANFASESVKKRALDIVNSLKSDVE